MRIDLNLKQRAIIAEWARRRSAWLTVRASERTMSEVRLEMESEAIEHLQLADRLMDFSVESEKSAGSLIVPTPDIDLKQLDQTAPPTPRAIPENQ